MKKIFSLLTLAVLALCASCDKIDPNDYLVPGGATGEWQAGSGVADKTQRALIEKYTGVRCTNCPEGDTRITAVLAKPEFEHRAFAVAIHGADNFSGYPIDGFDPRTDDGRTWTTHLANEGKVLPLALIQRNTDAPIIPNADDIETPLREALSAQPTVAIATTASLLDRTANITVNVELLETPSTELYLTLFLMEDGIKGPQSGASAEQLDDDGLYTHNHVLRDVITDIWGAPVPSDLGDKLTVRYEYTLDNNDWVAENCKVVAFISTGTGKEQRILNVAECEL